MGWKQERDSDLRPGGHRGTHAVCYAYKGNYQGYGGFSFFSNFEYMNAATWTNPNGVGYQYGWCDTGYQNESAMSVLASPSWRRRFCPEMPNRPTEDKGSVDDICPGRTNHRRFLNRPSITAMLEKDYACSPSFKRARQAPSELAMARRGLALLSPGPTGAGYAPWSRRTKSHTGPAFIFSAKDAQLRTPTEFRASACTPCRSL